MRIVIGGASGFLGAPLVSALRQCGHDVTRLVRGDATDADASPWDPVAGEVDEALIADADVVVNLSGAPISQWPRTGRRAQEILRSRLGATSTLARAVAHAPTPPALLSGSGMSWYGVDRGPRVLTEDEGPGEGFLAEVSQAWEAAATPAVEAGARVVYLRTSMVLDGSGGALKLMKIPFSLGVGARIGSGRQYLSCISRRDWVEAVRFVAEHDDLAGPVNLSAPAVPTNAEFTRSLARTLGRPAPFAAPSFAVRAALGGIAEDLLGSLRLQPRRLTEAGFSFAHRDVDEILAAALA
ncbi:TIGR01777 family protein [Aeromicrobium phragmitis]|uniref:TIGR01777 family protein n=1 Tax=Aeromicrobium phragmitis TaxID=2478914 RepID=A0A3L8PMI1_9ACTN|nr:TIGR01777 family oxidoreductase [Aeromicrobium phragmitis]RLV55963.1 TIGR01777 family protein [Aeromicrobium phragmitis]